MKRLISYCQSARRVILQGYFDIFGTTSSAVVVLIATLMTALIVFGMDYVLGVRPTGAEGLERSNWYYLFNLDLIRDAGYKMVCSS